LREARIGVGDFVDLQNFPDGVVPTVPPNDAGFAAFKAFGECAGKNDVSNAVFVSDPGHEAFDDSLCGIYGYLNSGSGFELDVIWHSWHG
jgi:hypothetical protein